MSAMISTLALTITVLTIYAVVVKIRRETREHHANMDAARAKADAVARLNAAGDKIEMQIITREAFNDQYRAYLDRIKTVVEELEC